MNETPPSLWGVGGVYPQIAASFTLAEGNCETVIKGSIGGVQLDTPEEAREKAAVMY